MGYQSRTGASRSFGGRQEKTRAKTKRQKDRLKSSNRLERDEVPTLHEVFIRTLDGLQKLGNQRFALQPYKNHFSLWLTTLKSVLSDFESNAAVIMDDQYVTECSRIVSEVESRLRERQLKETSGEKALQNLAEAKKVIERIDNEYTAKQNELKRRIEDEITSTSTKVDVLESELGRISRLRTSIFRGLSRKTKAQQEDEAKRNLVFAKGIHATATHSFIEEDEKLKEEYEKMKKPVILQIEEYQREIQNSGAGSQDDYSIEIRREACDSLIDSVKRLVDRMQSTGKEAF